MSGVRRYHYFLPRLADDTGHISAVADAPATGDFHYVSDVLMKMLYRLYNQRGDDPGGLAGTAQGTRAAGEGSAVRALQQYESA